MSTEVAHLFSVKCIWDDHINYPTHWDLLLFSKEKGRAINCTLSIGTNWEYPKKTVMTESGLYSLFTEMVNFYVYVGLKE